MYRVFDISFSAIALIISSPFLLLLMGLLRCTGEGDIFYTQQRVGKGGKEFGLLKFATMLRDSPNIGTGVITVRNDPRVLPIGRLLRKTKLNELPQLWNIFRGDLSIVGPRPMVPSTYQAYPPDARELLDSVKPGLSGVGSVVFRDEEAFLDAADDPRHFYNRVVIPYKAQLERWYVEHMSLRLYFEVILLTAWAIVFRNTRLPWYLWPSLPNPPKELTDAAVTPA